jgi:acetyl esterase/lipase
MISRTLGSVFLALSAMSCNAQEGVVIPLWEAGAPGFEDRKDEAEEAKDWWVKNIHNPTLTAYLPKAEESKGVAVLVCPGGGHRLLVVGAEGMDAAKYLQSMGYAAFVLKYRLGREEDTPYSIEKHALEDGQRAMRIIRSRAEEFGVSSDKIGMLGFSAGGEVVSMVTYADPKTVVNPTDDIDRLSSHPDFQMLVYPGPLGIPETLPKNSPPAFLLVANDDGAAKNILSLVAKYRKIDRPVEAHLYASGGHGFNLGQRSSLQSINTWPKRMEQWLNDYIASPQTGDK